MPKSKSPGKSKATAISEKVEAIVKTEPAISDNNVKNNAVETNSKKSSSQKSSSQSRVSWIDIVALIVLVLITIFTHPHINGDSRGHVPLAYVWYYGWITAVSTGLGAIPFFFVSETTKFWTGVSNCTYFIKNKFNYQISPIIN